MEFAESFGDIEYDSYITDAKDQIKKDQVSLIKKKKKQAERDAKEERQSIVVNVAWNPQSYSNGMRTNCAHDLVSFPSYCLARDGVRRMYCTNCPTVVLSSRRGVDGEYCIRRDVYDEIIEVIDQSTVTQPWQGFPVIPNSL